MLSLANMVGEWLVLPVVKFKIVQQGIVQMVPTRIAFVFVPDVVLENLHTHN